MQIGLTKQKNNVLISVATKTISVKFKYAKYLIVNC
jgi:hypothetical protein